MATIPGTELSKLRRFLALGCETGTYYVNSEEKDPVVDKKDNIVKLLEDGNGQQVLDELQQYSNDLTKPVIFAYAVCAKLSKDAKIKSASYKAFSKALKCPEHLFVYVIYSELLSKTCNSTGWGRAQRKVVSDWYNNQEPGALAANVTQCIQRGGWSHTDLLRLGHVKPKKDAVALVMNYILKGFKATKEKYEKESTVDGLQVVLSYLEGVDTVKHTKEEQLAASIVEKHKLRLQHIPTWFQGSKEVWQSVMENMTTLELLKNLPKLASLGLLTKDSRLQETIDKIKASVTTEKLSPYEILVALRNYKQTKSDKAKLKWQVDQDLIDALNAAFYDAFKSLVPTGKRYLMGVDTSGSMQYGGTFGSPQVSPATAAAAMALGVAQVEKDYNLVAFSSDIVPLTIKDGMTVEELQQTMSDVPMGGANPTGAMKWALDNNKHFDTFVVFTDCETWAAQSNTAEMLKKYREQSGVKDARLVVCTLTSTKVSVADPNDSAMLDICGFSPSTPDIIHRFAAAKL